MLLSPHLQLRKIPRYFLTLVCFDHLILYNRYFGMSSHHSNLIDQENLLSKQYSVLCRLFEVYNHLYLLSKYHLHNKKSMNRKPLLLKYISHHPLLLLLFHQSTDNHYFPAIAKTCIYANLHQYLPHNILYYQDYYYNGKLMLLHLDFS